MRISAVSTVKNCLDILPIVLETLKRQGVQDFYILDHGSTDGTSEYLSYLQSKGLVNVARLPESSFYQSAKNTALSRIAAQQGADWIIPFDADEFWITPEGMTFQDCLRDVPLSVGKVSVEVDNYVQESSIEIFDYKDMSTVRFRAVEKVGLSDRQSQKAVSSGKVSFLCVPFLRKVIFRASPDAVLHTGQHDVDLSLRSSNSEVASTIRIAHLPFRASWLVDDRVKQGLGLQESGFDKSVGWQSQSLVDLSAQALDDYLHSVTWHEDGQDHPGLILEPDDTICSLTLEENSPFNPPAGYSPDLLEPDLNDMLIIECLRRIGNDLKVKSRRDRLNRILFMIR